MEIKAYVCPQCGASLDVSQSTTFTFCPHCGNKLHISYADEGPNPNLQTFTTTNGLPIATAIIPSDYQLEATLNESWQSELVPLTTFIRATSPNRDIILSSASKEIFYDARSIALKTIIGLIQNHTNQGYIKYIEPKEYLKQWAEKMTGITLTPVAETSLPSPLGQHPDLAKANLQADIDLYVGTYMECHAVINAQECKSVLYKYEGEQSGQKVIALVGADYQEADIKMPEIAGFAEMGDVANKAMDGLKNIIGGKDSPSFMETAKNMTMSDWMKGGIVGKMMRDKKERQSQQPSEPIQQEPPQEKKHHGTVVLFGSQRRYLCFALADKEKEATEAFLNFIQTITPDQAIAQKESALIQQKIAMVKQEVANNQAMAQQSQQRLRQLQQQTSQMIARNSQQASAGIMDSWNKKMESQSRISESYSEAIRGVDSYVTPSGNTVEMSTAADHVYQNQYGDTIGVSGNAIDDEIVSKLNWTELDKK